MKKKMVKHRLSPQANPNFGKHDVNKKQAKTRRWYRRTKALGVCLVIAIGLLGHQLS